MTTYTILLAQDIPHYGTTEITAADASGALERAKDLDISELCNDPDWEHPVCSRIVHIADEAGALVAHDVALDGYVLHHKSEPRADLCARAPALQATLERIAAIPLYGERLSDPALRAEFISAGEYDAELEEFEPSADTESSYLREAVEAARSALSEPLETSRPRHSNVCVYVRGGAVQSAETLEGKPVLIDVIDYDTSDAVANLDRDRNGDPCLHYTM
jgi:hypothetical protein